MTFYSHTGRDFLKKTLIVTKKSTFLWFVLVVRKENGRFNTIR